MAITAPGIGSNLDVNSIVSQLMQIEQQPLTLLAKREATFQARLSSLGSLKGALSSLQSASQSLADIATVAYRATSSDTSVVTGSAVSTATAGVHSIEITDLAQSQRLAALGRASLTAGIGAGADTTISFSFGTITGGTLNVTTGKYTGVGSFDVNADHAGFSVTIGSSNNTLEGIRDAINAADGGVTASIVNDGSATPYRLMLIADDTGVANSLKIAVSGDATIGTLLAHDPDDDAGQNLAQTRLAQDAALTVDGLAVSSETNSVTDALQGVTLTLLKETTTAITLTVARDNSTATGALGAFVKAFNDYNAALRAATGKGASLQGSSMALGVDQRLRAALGTSYGTGTYTRLSSLGVVGQLDGSLKLDLSKLDAALTADAATARAILSGAGTALEAIADGAVGTEGTFAAAATGIDASIKSLGERRDGILRRLASVEKRYRAQFTALDMLMSKMSQTSSFLQQQLTALSNSTGK